MIIRFHGGPLDGRSVVWRNEIVLGFMRYQVPWCSGFEEWKSASNDTQWLAFERNDAVGDRRVYEGYSAPNENLVRENVDFHYFGRISRQRDRYFHYERAFIRNSELDRQERCFRTESTFGVAPAPGVITDVAELAQRELPHTCCFDCGSQVLIADVWTKKADPNYALCEGCFRRAEMGGRARIAKET